ncbi:flippase [Aquimarina macrocephali]|uniref:flippase n=1 Tax=Aquimarina macrocephali TaxID=666563 RepID=UPI00046570CD|nr:flippase [Aquimarina macrocephali]
MKVSNRITTILSKNKILLKNFSYLGLLQIFNLAVPLLTYPYLIRVLGEETYGLVIFAQAVIAYLVILVSFGFNKTATREVSIHRNDKEKLSEIISSVFIIKGLIFIASFLFLYIILHFIPSSRNQEILFYLSLWLCFFEWIFPLWYFQGIEQMKFITVITLISRLVFLALIFILIKEKKDYLYLPIINGLGALAAGFVSLYIVFSRHKVKFKFQNKTTLFFYAKESLAILTSDISITLYVSTNKVLVGTFLGMNEVAYYDLAEKLLNLIRLPILILGQALFPKVSKEKNIYFVKKIAMISLLGICILYVGLVIFGKYIVLFLGGPEMSPTVSILWILCLSAPFTALNNIFGNQLLIPFGYLKAFNKAVIMTCLTYFIIIGGLWTIKEITLINVSIVTVIVEALVALFTFYYCVKFNLWEVKINPRFLK